MSDKEPKETSESKKSMKMNDKQKRMGAMIIVAIILLGIGFAGGMQFQKNKKQTAGTMAATVPGGATGLGTRNGRLGGRFGGAFGSVTTVSSASITVKNTRTGADQTFSIDSSTTVTDNGSASTIDVIKVGDSVLVRADTTTTTKAASIMLNPQIPSAGGGGFGGGAPSDSQAPAN